MSVIVVAFTKEGVLVADSAAGMATLLGMADAGTAATVTLRFANNAAPAAESVKNLQDIEKYATLIKEGSLAANVKEAFATVLGTLAGIAVLPAGPAASIAADAGFSTAFSNAFDAVYNWSGRQDWTPLFDFLDATFAMFGRFGGSGGGGGAGGNGGAGTENDGTNNWPNIPPDVDPWELDYDVYRSEDNGDGTMTETWLKDGEVIFERESPSNYPPKEIEESETLRAGVGSVESSDETSSEEETKDDAADGSTSIKPPRAKDPAGLSGPVDSAFIDRMAASLVSSLGEFSSSTNGHIDVSGNYGEHFGRSASHLGYVAVNAGG